MGSPKDSEVLYDDYDWKALDGRVFQWKDLEDDHLVNILHFMRRRVWGNGRNLKRGEEVEEARRKSRFQFFRELARGGGHPSGTLLRDLMTYSLVRGGPARVAVVEIIEEELDLVEDWGYRSREWASERIYGSLRARETQYRVIRRLSALGFKMRRKGDDELVVKASDLEELLRRI